VKRWLAVYALAFFAFLHLPLLTLAVFSFNSSRFTTWEGFSFDWYRAILRDPQLIEATWNSIVVALAATLISTVAGTLCAYGLWKRGSRLLTGTLYLSLVTPYSSAASPPCFAARLTTPRHPRLHRQPHWLPETPGELIRRCVQPSFPVQSVT